MRCSIGRSKEHNIDIPGKMRELAAYAASIPEEENTVTSIFVLLATDLHDGDMGVDTRNEHLFDHSKLGQVVGDIAEINVVRRRVQVWVVKPHSSRGINATASSANAILNIHLEPPFLTPITPVQGVIFQSLPELTKEG